MRRLGLGATVLIILGAIVFLWLIKAPVMSAYLSNRLNIPISIGYISMWPSKSTIKNFIIENPRGFKTSYAFKSARAEIDYRLSELFADPAQINTIALSNVFLSVEFSKDFKKTNWSVLNSRFSKTPRGKHVILHHLILTNITVAIKGLPEEPLGSPKTLTIDRMEFDELDSAQGFPTKEVIGKIFEQAGIEAYIEEAPMDFIENLTDPLKNFED